MRFLRDHRSAIAAVPGRRLPAPSSFTPEPPCAHWLDPLDHALLCGLEISLAR